MIVAMIVTAALNGSGPLEMMKADKFIRDS